MKLRELRKLILKEFAPASGTDPRNPDGFYPYDIERGVDIHSFWAASPGDKGSNPMRPGNAKEYIGQIPPDESNSELPKPARLSSDDDGNAPVSSLNSPTDDSEANGV